MTSFPQKQILFLAVHIRHLREKVEEQPSQPAWILTARGLGYKLAKEGTK